MKRLWTVGHSTRSIEDFLGLLSAHGIELLVDVRAFPGSRRHPQFGRGALEKSLAGAGVAYRWMGVELGGRRKPRERSPNDALRSASFRAFADYMMTPEFREGLDALLEEASTRRTAVLCAEALWWKCHRSMIADYAAAARGWTVLHIMGADEAPAHAPRAEARREGETLVYDRR